MADQKVSDLPALSGADVDPADLLYIIDSSAGSAGSKKITVGQYQLAPVSGGTANGVVYLNGSKVVTTGSDLVFDGTNLGIGTSSPGAKLDVNGGSIRTTSWVDITPSTATNNALYRSTNTGGTFYSGLDNSAGGVTGTGYAGAIWHTGAYPIGFGTSNALRMTLDSSGNLGLGVTPSAWAGDKALQVNWGSISSGYEYSVNVSSVAYRDNATWKYLASSQAPARYEQIGGAHKWFTAPTGTAGNTISFTQAMTLDADGDLGIGSTSPSAGLDVRKQETSAYNTARFSNGTDIQFLDVVCGRALTNGTVGGVSSSLVMTLRSSGSSSGHLAFATGNDERARVTQGGDFLVGTSTLVGVGGITLQSITSGFAIVNNNNAAATGYVFESFRRSSTEIGSITQNGTTAVQYNTTSDRRLKDNIVPAPSASDVIDAIEIVSHDWKAAPDEHVTYGVIAQDLALVAPQAVLQGDDGEEIKKTWGVDYSKLVPMLIKEIQSLRARVAALESA